MINDYPSLQTAVRTWLARNDLVAEVPGLIQMAELRIQNDLNAAEQMTTAAFTTAGGYYNLPSNFDSAYSVTLSMGGVNVPVQPLTSTDGLAMDTAGLPVGYWIDSYPVAVPGVLEPDAPLRLFRLNLSGGADYSGTLVYKAKFQALSDTAPVNWLVTSQPNIYLYATLLEAAPFLQDDARISVWGAGYSEAIAAYNKRADRVRFSPAPRRRVDFHAC